MIRITGGQWRGRQIHSPKDQGARPTTGMVRESLFSILQPYLAESTFLDLFAGSGMVGIEALSRGARQLISVESDRSRNRLIRQNYDLLGISSQTATLVSQDVMRFVSQSPLPKPIQIAFLDPPYDYPYLEAILTHLLQSGWMASQGIIVAEHRSTNPISLPGFTQRNYGDTALSICYIVP